jgi:hypothetical protein
VERRHPSLGINWIPCDILETVIGQVRGRGYIGSKGDRLAYMLHYRYKEALEDVQEALENTYWWIDDEDIIQEIYLYCIQHNLNIRRFQPVLDKVFSWVVKDVLIKTGYRIFDRFKTEIYDEELDDRSYEMEIGIDLCPLTPLCGIEKTLVPETKYIFYLLFNLGFTYRDIASILQRRLDRTFFETQEALEGLRSII